MRAAAWPFVCRARVCGGIGLLAGLLSTLLLLRRPVRVAVSRVPELVGPPALEPAAPSPSPQDCALSARFRSAADIGALRDPSKTFFGVAGQLPQFPVLVAFPHLAFLLNDTSEDAELPRYQRLPAALLALIPRYDSLAELRLVDHHFPFGQVVTMQLDDAVALRAYLSGSVWLDFAKLDGRSGHLDDSDLLRKLRLFRSDLQATLALPLSPNVTDILLTRLTLQAAYLEGIRWPARAYLEFVSGCVEPVWATAKDLGIVASFARGLRWALSELVAKPAREWMLADLLRLHSLVCAGCEIQAAGALRIVPVNVGTLVTCSPLELPAVMAVFVDWLRRRAACLQSFDEFDLQHWIRFALDAYVNLLYIHPFQDGNGERRACVRGL